MNEYNIKPIMVGGSRAHFDDDVEFNCEKCGKKIYFRPYAFEEVEGKKVCARCIN